MYKSNKIDSFVCLRLTLREWERGARHYFKSRVVFASHRGNGKWTQDIIPKHCLSSLDIEGVGNGHKTLFQNIVCLHLISRELEMDTRHYSKTLFVFGWHREWEMDTRHYSKTLFVFAWHQGNGKGTLDIIPKHCLSSLDIEEMGNWH